MAQYMNCFEVREKIGADGGDVFYVLDKNMNRVYGSACTREDAESFASALNRAYTDFINIRHTKVNF
jgi:hypothetical protein